MPSILQQYHLVENNAKYLRKHRVQTKLNINTPGDPYEQEADAMADRVMRMSADNTHVTGIVGASVQRKCAECEEEENRNTVMRKTGGSTGGIQASSCFSTSLVSSKGGGVPLTGDTRSFMENAFNADFSRVRIHSDSKATEMNIGISARAFTYGNDIYFNKNEYSPQTNAGRKLLAHELTHVLQQANSNSTIQRFANCRPYQNRDIHSALARARRRSTRAIQIVGEIQAGTNPRAAAILRRQFGMLTTAQLTTVRDRMVVADGRLNNNSVWRCDTAATYDRCGDPYNWFAGTTCGTTSTATHLCPRFFGYDADTGRSTEPTRAMILIHEGLRAAGACPGNQPPGIQTPPGSLTNVFSYTRFIYAVASADR